jgi:phosphomannomutase
MAKKDLMISVAGIRGIVGDSIIPEEYLKYVMAFSNSLKNKKIILGGDSRKSREMMRHIAFSGLIATGIEVIDIGIAPTPTVGLLVKELNAGGGIAITASHNPREWNAYKFFSDKGIFLNKEEFNALMQIYLAGEFKLARIDEIGKVVKNEDAFRIHLNKIFNYVNVDIIRQKKVKVVVDCCNGAGSEIIPQLLEDLNCESIIINNDITKEFPHIPEPLPENIGELCEKVKETGADIGFAIDPDADRVAIVDETGKAIGEERSVTLATNYVLSKKKGPVVVNLSTTRAVDDVAKRNGVNVFRTPIGEAYVAKKMLDIGSVIGGEGNGGIMIPGIHPCRDAIAGIALILEMLVKSKKKISEVNKTIPDYAIIKKKYEIDREKYETIINAVRFKFQKASMTDIDGLKISFEKSWIHLRLSGTEPILRLFVEAPTKDVANDLIREVEHLVLKFK